MGRPRYHSRGCDPPRPEGTVGRPPPRPLWPEPADEACAPSEPEPAEPVEPEPAEPAEPEPAEPAEPEPAEPVEPEPVEPLEPAEPLEPSPGSACSRPDCVSYIRIMPLWL